MQGRRTALIVRMDEAPREQLLGWLRATKTPQGLAKRATAMLLLANGQSYAATARQVGLRERHVRKWARRFLRDGPAGLHDAPRSGRPPVFSPRRGDSSGQDGVRAAG
jgi:transposase